MRLPSQITSIQYAGHSALQLTTRYGKAVMALQGAHLLSWIPAGQSEVFWLSPACLPEPAAIRGGVPVCWPWFAKQGQSSTSIQHGPVRNLPWQVSTLHECSDDEISLTLKPILPPANRLAAAGISAGLHVSLRITLGQTLRQSLQTHNLGRAPFELSQALHSYYAVSHAQRVAIEGLQGLTYTDRLRDLTQDVQRNPFALGHACDRTYAHPLEVPAQLNHSYTLVDPAWQRRIVIEVQGSSSVVVWNPGQETARNIVDVPDGKWPDFMCIEATNAGPDVINLQSGQLHALSQHVRTELAC